MAPVDDLAPQHPLPPWAGLSLRDLWRRPLPAIGGPLERTVLRAVATLARHQVADIDRWELVLPERDPFILVANHGSRRETVYLAAALMLARGGRPVHFLADWNFGLIPGVGWFYARAGVITVTRKDARPRVLNRLKPWFLCATPAMAQARERLAAGGSVALFPEGTVNRDPRRLLRGRFGAARLSLETGVPVVPVGIRLRGRTADNLPSDPGSPMSIQIGAPLRPPGSGPAPAAGEALALAEVRAWHAEIMTAIARLCGKHWSWDAAPAAQRGLAILPTPSQPRALGPGGPWC